MEVAADGRFWCYRYMWQVLHVTIKCAWHALSIKGGACLLTWRHNMRSFSAPSNFVLFCSFLAHCWWTGIMSYWWYYTLYRLVRSVDVATATGNTSFICLSVWYVFVHGCVYTYMHTYACTYTHHTHTEAERERHSLFLQCDIHTCVGKYQYLKQYAIMCEPWNKNLKSKTLLAK